MIPPKTIKLRTRIALYFLAILLAWSVVLLTALREVLLWRFEHVYRDRGAEITSSVLAECIPLVEHEDSLNLAEVPPKTMAGNQDVRYVVVEDDVGKILTSTFPGGGVPRDLRSLAHAKLPGKDVQVRLVEYQGEWMFDCVSRKGPATVRLGFSLASAHEFVARITMYLVWFGAAGIISVFIAAYRISRPIEELSAAINADPVVDSRRSVQTLQSATVETSQIMNRFEELTGRLQEKSAQLEVAQKLGYLGELSASLAHEVNNPLGVVVLNSGLLARRCESGEIADEAAREVETLKLAARRATLAVQGLLQFARYSARGAEPAGMAEDLEPMIRETIELLADRFRARECHPSVEIAESLPPVRCDTRGIQQVLFNLVLNALDACDAGGNIGIRASADSESFVLEVVDDGSGMTDEVLSRAKEPFFTTKEEERGVGLGLAISESIVVAHGGSLAFFSRPGQGTRATVRIPLRSVA